MSLKKFGLCDKQGTVGENTYFIDAASAAEWRL